MWRAIINTVSITETLIGSSMIKGALVSFIHSLTISLAKKKTGIRVNAIAPGLIWMPLIPVSFDENKTFQHGIDIPMARVGQPVECAGVYVFLASENASCITG